MRAFRQLFTTLPILLLAVQPAAQESDPFKEIAPPVAPSPGTDPFRIAPEQQAVTPPVSRSRPRPHPAPEPEPVIAPPPAPRPRSAVEEVIPVTPNAEIIFWQSIADSGNAADFEEYLKQYPSGQFAGLARRRIAALQAPTAAVSASPATDFDGTYVGAVSVLPGPNRSSRQGASSAGVSTRQIEFCDPSAYDNRIEIRNGQFAFIYNRRTAKRMTGKVSGDSSLDGLGATDFGGVRLTAHIQSGELVGTIISADCRYELHLHRQ